MAIQIMFTKMERSNICVVTKLVMQQLLHENIRDQVQLSPETYMFNTTAEGNMVAMVVPHYQTC